MPIMTWAMLAVFVLGGFETYRRQMGRERALREVALRSPRGGDPVLLPEDLRMFEMSATDRAATLVRAATH